MFIMYCCIKRDYFRKKFFFTKTGWEL